MPGLFSCFTCGADAELFELPRSELKKLYDKCIAVNKGKLIVRGIFARADTKNNNKRVYPKYILKREVAKFEQEHISRGTALGELDHPNYASRYFKCMNLPNISHQVLGVQWKGDQLWGTIEVLPTPSGLLLWELYAQGIKLGVSSRGWASLRTDTRAKCVFVDDDFELITFDFVTEPSTKGAYLVPMSVPYKHPVPDQTKCVQTAFLGHGVVSMRNIPRLPSVNHLARRIKELQEEANDYHRLATGYQQPLDFTAPCPPGAPPLQPTASLAAARAGRGRSLDQLLLFCHYIVFPGAPYLDREEHARDFQAHVALFATRAHLADQEQFAHHRADFNAVVLQEVVKQQTKRAAGHALQDPASKPQNSSAVAVAAGVPTPSLAAPPQALCYGSLQKRPQLPGQAAASAAAAAQAAAVAVSVAAARKAEDPQLAGHASCKPVPVSASDGTIVGVNGKQREGMQSSTGGHHQQHASWQSGKTNSRQQQQGEGLTSSLYAPALASSEARICCQPSASLPAPQGPPSPLLYCPSSGGSGTAQPPYPTAFASLSAHHLGRPSPTHAPEQHPVAAGPTHPSLEMNPATCAPLAPLPLSTSEPPAHATPGLHNTHALPSSNAHVLPPRSPCHTLTQQQEGTQGYELRSSSSAGAGGGVETSLLKNGDKHRMEPSYAQPLPLPYSSSLPASLAPTLLQDSSRSRAAGFGGNAAKLPHNGTHFIGHLDGRLSASTSLQCPPSLSPYAHEKRSACVGQAEAAEEGNRLSIMEQEDLSPQGMLPGCLPHSTDLDSWMQHPSCTVSTPTATTTAVLEGAPPGLSRSKDPDGNMCVRTSGSELQELQHVACGSSLGKRQGGFVGVGGERDSGVRCVQQAARHPRAAHHLFNNQKLQQQQHQRHHQRPHSLQGAEGSGWQRQQRQQQPEELVGGDGAGRSQTVLVGVACVADAGVSIQGEQHAGPVCLRARARGPREGNTGKAQALAAGIAALASASSPCSYPTAQRRCSSSTGRSASSSCPSVRRQCAASSSIGGSAYSPCPSPTVARQCGGTSTGSSPESSAALPSLPSSSVPVLPSPLSPAALTRASSEATSGSNGGDGGDGGGGGSGVKGCPRAVQGSGRQGADDGRGSPVQDSQDCGLARQEHAWAPTDGHQQQQQQQQQQQHDKSRNQPHPRSQAGHPQRQHHHHHDQQHHHHQQQEQQQQQYQQQQRVRLKRGSKALSPQEFWSKNCGNTLSAEEAQQLYDELTLIRRTMAGYAAKQQQVWDGLAAGAQELPAVSVASLAW